MKCTQCKEGAVVFQRAVLPILGGDIYADGVQVGTCGACGERFTSYPKSGLMLDAVAQALINKPSRLTGREIRFMRSKLGLRGEEFAAQLGVTAAQVSRWENAAPKEGKAVVVSATADRLIRMLVALAGGFKVGDLAAIDSSDPEPLTAVVRLARGKWKVDTSPEAQAQIALERLRATAA